jgi:hypothetical protein
MALWNKLRTELDRAGRVAQGAIDEGKLRLEIFRARQLVDRAAQSLGYAVYRSRAGLETPPTMSPWRAWWKRCASVSSSWRRWRSVCVPPPDACPLVETRPRREAPRPTRHQRLRGRQQTMQRPSVSRPHPGRDAPAGRTPAGRTPAGRTPAGRLGQERGMTNGEVPTLGPSPWWRRPAAPGAAQGVRR